MTKEEEKAVETLNFYRNCHYADSSTTESYLLADAINTILPEFIRLTKERDKQDARATETPDLY